MREEKDLRLFFALWPTEAVRRNLQRAAETIELPTGARRVPAANLHITLHFIGNVERRELACLTRQAREVNARRFEIIVDRVDCFDKPRVGWLGLRRLPEPLSKLHLALGSQLGNCGFVPEDRPYRPHVTILRKHRGPVASTDFEPIAWSVDDFALVESRSSENGVQYRVLETFPLT